jgi:hypothetical protein
MQDHRHQGTIFGNKVGERAYYMTTDAPLHDTATVILGVGTSRRFPHGGNYPFFNPNGGNYRNTLKRTNLALIGANFWYAIIQGQLLPCEPRLIM